MKFQYNFILDQFKLWCPRERSWFCRQGVTQGLHLRIKSPFNLHSSYFQGNFSGTGANCSFSFPELPHPWVSSCSNHGPGAAFSAPQTPDPAAGQTTTFPSAFGWAWEEKSVEWGCAKATLEFPSGSVPCPALPTRLSSRTMKSRLFQAALSCPGSGPEHCFPPVWKQTGECWRWEKEERVFSALPVVFFSCLPWAVPQKSLAKVSLPNVGFGNVTLLNLTSSP